MENEVLSLVDFYNYSFAFLGNEDEKNRNELVDNFICSDSSYSYEMDKAFKEYLLQPAKSGIVRKWYKEFLEFLNK